VDVGKELRQILGELGVLDAVPAAVLESADGANVETVEEVVGRLDLAIQAALASSLESGVDPAAPESILVDTPVDGHRFVEFPDWRYGANTHGTDAQR
jgi:hypothetical protein